MTDDLKEFLQFAMGKRCSLCARKVPLVENSVGFYSHREEGNHCDNDWLVKLYDEWQMRKANL